METTELIQVARTLQSDERRATFPQLTALRLSIEPITGKAGRLPALTWLFGRIFNTSKDLTFTEASWLMSLKQYRCPHPEGSTEAGVWVSPEFEELFDYAVSQVELIPGQRVAHRAHNARSTTSD